MRLSAKTLERLTDIVTGNTAVTPYRTAMTVTCQTLVELRGDTLGVVIRFVPDVQRGKDDALHLLGTIELVQFNPRIVSPGTETLPVRVAFPKVPKELYQLRTWSGQATTRFLNK